MFDFVPKIVIVPYTGNKNPTGWPGAALTWNNDTMTILITDILTEEYQEWVSLGVLRSGTGSGAFAKKSHDGKTIFWYALQGAQYSADNQLNSEGSCYFYCGIG